MAIVIFVCAGSARNHPKVEMDDGASYFLTRKGENKLGRSREIEKYKKTNSAKAGLTKKKIPGQLTLAINAFPFYALPSCSFASWVAFLSCNYFFFPLILSVGLPLCFFLS